MLLPSLRNHTLFLFCFLRKPLRCAPFVVSQLPLIGTSKFSLVQSFFPTPEVRIPRRPAFRQPHGLLSKAEKMARLNPLTQSQSTEVVTVELVPSGFWAKKDRLKPVALIVTLSANVCSPDVTMPVMRALPSRIS